jgi:hypothetical protein
MYLFLSTQKPCEEMKLFYIVLLIITYILQFFVIYNILKSKIKKANKPKRLKNHG